MDIKRPILIVALAVVSYLMVLQWNQDYGQVQLPPEQTRSTAPAAKSTQAAPGADDDVPLLEPEIGAVTEEAPGSTELIRVRTDVLELAIDPRGGDIVELMLPKYPRRQDRPDVPFQLFENSNERFYIASSGLTGVKAANSPDSSQGRELWISKESSYEMAASQDELVVDLTLTKGGVEFVKRFRFKRGDYDIGVNYLIDNRSDSAWRGSMYGQLKRDASGDPSSTTATGTATYLGAALWTPDKPYTKVKMGEFDDMQEENAKNVPNSWLELKVEGGWIAWLQHYFVTAWIPKDPGTNNIKAFKDSRNNYVIRFTGPTLEVPAGSQGETRAVLYAGPKIQEKLEALSPGLRLTVDYSFLWFIAQPIFWLLENIHDFLGNWGWSIIALTVVIKLIFFPLSAASYRSMARMRAVSPKLQALKEQYGDDRQKMSQAMMELYKKEKINPLGGCLPILVQMPVFLALYWVLLESVEMRQAPWMFWITDLSIKDPFFILPIIMGVTMFIQQQLNPTPPDPMQAKVMKMLPIIFTFFFLWFPAGLVLYWVVNNILSIAQQWYITRQIEAASKKAG
ncbi:membrane protein insertase YidC [Pseudomonas mangrovi]|mgnify:CR=1 FL=1|uniref:Membrane protein insertase YidC n=1 Tax=Pseudomonas mangrovi TaxID=2161748 RepID=A0A2T5P9X2_9PSED|nr:membrane protein insertase YidC [Pseudomonas mangrovi]PTU74527.1 membrane protein insertase YidC [Pseudomonas mangrovi]